MSSPLAASMHMLPPSPELRGIDIPNRDDDFMRLQSMADYQTLQPQSLAVCRNRGAVAGSKGIAVFDVQQPHVPTLLLHHAAHVSTTASHSTVLKFASSDSRWLASARGSGILVWDVSGSCLSPLQHRLGGLSDDPLDAVESMDWAASQSHCLLASSSHSAGLWDLRQKTVRPTIRFASSLEASYRQIVSSSSAEAEQCAILDTAGVVRVFDNRMQADNNRPNGRLHQFQAFQQCGIGMNSWNGNRYLAWGTDKANADPVVKAFHLGDLPVSGNSESVDDYWNMDSSPERNSRTSSATVSSQHSTHSLVAKCIVPHLACARVVPSPVIDQIVTIAIDHSVNDWEADLWRVNAQATQKLERIASFQGSNDLSVSAADSEMTVIRAAELTVSDDSELLLCCLTSHGYVTTHAIPESLSTTQQRDSKTKISSKKVDPKIPSSVSNATRLFPSDSEWAVSDAAKAWSRPASETMTASTVPDRLVDRRDAPLTSEENQTTEASLMPFEMEVPVVYSMVNPNRSNEDANATSAMSSLEEAEIEKSNSKDAKALMDRIETARIPCPRFCGASFSSGVGGLVSFRNGDVKGMWKWWKQNNPTRLASVPGIIGEATQSNQDVQSTQRQDSQTKVDPAQRPPVAITTCPRTLKDLKDMTAAAKEAQWRERHHDSEESSAGESSNFYDDESDGSSDSGEEHGDEHNQQIDISKNNKTMISEASDQMSQEQYPRGTTGETYKHSPYHSDLPLVNVTHEFDRIALNNQNPRLASTMRLGEFLSFTNNNTRSDPDGDAFVSRHGLPSYRSLLPTSKSIGARQQSQKSALSIEEEKGVHGGEFSVRPNAQESMVFLRKMLTHTSPDGSGYPTVISPALEDPVRLRGPETNGSSQFAGQRICIGVYTVKTDNCPNLLDSLTDFEDILLQNAMACGSDGQCEKRDSWLLLAKIVRDRVTQKYHEHDGWGGRSGGSLGVGLANNILRYYESVGDVQMLATIVCVLRFGQRWLVDGKKQILSLLPSEFDIKYDTYLRRYADLLYGWGLLTTRAEVIKHLVNFEAETVYPGTESGQEEDLEREPGVALSFQCSRCSSSSEFGTNFCRKCQDYAFRCSICDNAVRGLLTVCSSCGHGGHAIHIEEWFRSNSECPSGCGCSCRGSMVVKGR